MPESDIPNPAAFVEDHGLLSWLDVTVDSWADGRAVLALPASDELRNHGQVDPAPIHGGATATVMDTASTAALRTTFDDPGAVWVTTTNLDVTYLRPATADLLVIADVVRAGGSTGVTDMTAVPADEYADEGDEADPVAIGRAHFRIFREGDR